MQPTKPEISAFLGVSIFLSCIALLSAVAFPPILTKKSTVAVVLSINAYSFGEAIAFLIGLETASESRAGCYFQGITANAFQLCETFWVTVLSIMLYRAVHPGGLKGFLQSPIWEYANDWRTHTAVMVIFFSLSALPLSDTTFDITRNNSFFCALDEEGANSVSL